MSSAPETPEISEPETESGYQSRSRSQSRRARRKKQTQKGGKKSQQMPSVPENQQTAQAQSQAQTQQQDVNGGQQNAQAASQASAQQENTMQPFEWIGPDETSMDGPVTYARAQRGEIPMREGNPDQRLKTAEKGGGESDMMKQDGLKLRLELNLDIEIELKARIQGDLTLALL